MSKYKKLGIGLSFGLAVFLFLFISPQKVSAEVISSQQQIEAGRTSLRFVNRLTIEGEFAGQTIQFIDQNPFDGTYNYKPSSEFFCSTGGTINGITIQGGAIAPDRFNSVAASVPALVDLDYNVNRVAQRQGCNSTNPDDLPAGVRTEGKAFIGMQWEGGSGYNLVSLPQASSRTSLSQLSTGSNLYVRNKTDKCFGNQVVLLGGDNHGTIYFIAPIGGGIDATDVPELKPFFTVSGCKVQPIGGELGFRIAIAGVRQQDPNAGGGPPANGQDPDTSSCAANFSSGFEWIICPVLKIADAAAGGFNNFIEDQLCFRTNDDGQPSSTGGVTCDESANNLTVEVKTAWAIIKNIATALLVIIVLAMIISQAVSIGPVDAYTIRKILPKLVIAVILIQLSWVLFKWTIDLSNDAGAGIRDLLLAPFGGIQATSLDNLIGPDTVTTSPREDAAFFLFGAVAAIVALANLPGLLLLAFYVVLALAIAFFVLTLRKILIIMLIILAPIALIAWILPGTERYWKMWSSNFTKLLMMFPLIMALLAAGRIFAWVTVGGNPAPSGGFLTPEIAVAHLGPISVPHIAIVGNFAELAIVIFAFFAPYFLLPKTFSWGGQLMGAVANAATNSRLMRNVHDKGGEAIKGFGERQRGRISEKYKPENQNFLKRGALRVVSGHYLPFSNRSRHLAIQTGEKWSAEETEMAYTYADRIYKKALSDPYKDKKGREWEPGVAGAKAALADMSRHENSRVAEGAIKKLIDTSSWPEIQSLTDSEGNKVFENNPNWEKTLAKSPEHYPKVLRSRVDAAPHILQSAKKRTYGTLLEGEDQKTVARWKNIDTETDEGKEQMAKLTVADLLGMDEAAKTAAGNSSLSKGHQRAFRMHYSIANQMSNEDLATQSEGFWTDMADWSQMEGGEAISRALRDKLAAIQHTGSAGQQILGHLSGGSIQAKVDKVASGKEGVPQASVIDYLGGRGVDSIGETPPSPRAAPRAAATDTPTPTTPAEPTPTTAPSAPTAPRSAPGRPSGGGWSPVPEYPPAFIVPHDDEPPAPPAPTTRGPGGGPPPTPTPPDSPPAGARSSVDTSVRPGVDPDEFGPGGRFPPPTIP